jgi:hypothetical protein
VVADRPSNSALSDAKVSVEPTRTDTFVATFDITYPNGKSSTGSFTVTRQ